MIHSIYNRMGMHYVLVKMGEEKTFIILHGTLNKIEVSLPLEILIEKWNLWARKGIKIQDAFPELSPSDREFIMTGTTAEEWALMFGRVASDSVH